MSFYRAEDAIVLKGRIALNKPPSFPFYPKDWSDFKVQRMSYEAQGIYINILCFMWKDSRDQCSILDNDKSISRSLGISIRKWQSIKKEIQFDGDPLLMQKGNKLISKKLKKISRELREYRKKQAEKGRKSALSRQTTVQQRLSNGSTGREPEGNSSSSSSSSKNKKKEKNNMSEKTFDILWKDWPKEGRFKKDYCQKKFNALCKAGKLERFKQTTRGYSEYLTHKKEIDNFDQRVMHLSTWLNNWEGEEETYMNFKHEPRL